MERFKVVRATEKDIEVLVHQRHEMFEDIRHRSREEHRIGDESYRTWAIGRLRRRLLRCFLVTDVRGTIVAGGCVWLREEQPGPGFPSGPRPYLMSMYTEPRFRRKGIASLIVGEALRWARNNGYESMTLHASKAGRKVYSKLGWKRTWEMEFDLEPEGKTRITAVRARSSRRAA